MPQSLSKVYVHIVFSTKYRTPLIDDKIELSLFQYLGGVCKKMDCLPIQVGGYRDHVHILCTLSRKITQSQLLEKVKKQSSKWIKTQGSDYEYFYWQSTIVIGRLWGIFSKSIRNRHCCELYQKSKRTSYQKNLPRRISGVFE